MSLMTGNNSMHLNEATMIQIVQNWIDNQTNLGVVVKSVTYTPRDHCFEIKTAGERVLIPDCENPDASPRLV